MFLEPRVGSLVEPLSDRHWDSGAVEREVRRRAAFLATQGVGPHDRVFLHHGNTPEFFVDLLAVWALGGCVVPIDQRLTPFEIDTLAGAARPRFSLWTRRPDPPLAAALAARGTAVLELPALGESPGCAPASRASQPALDDDALILFTSGTTGQPKGVVHTHRSLRARWITLRQHLGVETFRRTLCLLPTHFGHGLICNSLYPWLSGQELHILPSYRPDLILQLGSVLDEHAITFLSSVPAVWRLALKTAAPPRRRTLEQVFCGSAPLSAHLWTEIGRWTGAARVLNAYGITETGSWVAGTTLPDIIPEDGLVGVPWGAVLAVVKSSSVTEPPGVAEPCAPGEEGFVWLNTPALMKGYLDRDDLTAQVVSRGWFMTGDIGALRDGRLYLCGRAREEINKGGLKVHPGDVDGVIERFPGVRDVCTFAVDDPLYGQNVGVAVVLDRGAPHVLRALRDWVSRHLSEQRRPVRWYVLDTIPRTTRGKVNREDVARHCAARAPARPGHHAEQGAA